jgi:ABC-type nitrate/sulfonate/bicarbonate transport system ATPase subunit
VGAPAADPFIRFDNVSLRYGGPEGTLAVEGATIDIPKGGFVSIVGPSGCGKSTLLKMVSGLIAPTAGRVVVGGKPVTGPLGFVGMAFQNPTPLPWYSVIDNVMLPLRIVEPYRSTFRAKYDEYRAKAEALLASPEVRVSMAHHAIPEVATKHLWRHRLRKILERAGIEPKASEPLAQTRGG